MLFDSSLDALSSEKCRVDLPRYFSDPTHRVGMGPEPVVTNQPILHTSYEFFLLIADATKLARLPQCIGITQFSKYKQLQRQYSRWESAMEAHGDLCGILFTLALQVLLFKADPELKTSDLDRKIGECLRESIKVIPLIDQGCYFTSFLLWPLAIFASVASFTEEIFFMRRCISLLATSSTSGQATYVLRRLERIWASNDGLGNQQQGNQRCSGLQLLLDGE